MNGCEALIKAIDAYIAKADEDLTDALDEAGFANPDATVTEITSLENQIAGALKSETAYINSKIRNSVDLEAFAEKWSDITADDTIDEALSRILLDEFNEQIPKLASAYIKKIDPALTVATITNRTVAWAENWSREIGSVIKINFHETIENILVSCLKDGKSVADFAQYIQESKITDEYYRARQIALTEMLRAHSVAQQEAIMQNPAVEGKEWVHTGSHRNKPRENHVAMNGVIVPKDEPFTLEGLDGVTYYPMYPRDPILPAGESVNCHCIHRGIVDEDIIGLSLEERQALQQQAIDEDNGKWDEEKEKWMLGDEDKELDARNTARAGIDDT
jgi:hypothetical protein